MVSAIRHGAGSRSLEAQPASFLHCFTTFFYWFLLLLTPLPGLRCGPVLSTQPGRIACGDSRVTPWPLSLGFSQHSHDTWGVLGHPCELRDFAGEHGIAGGGQGRRGSSHDISGSQKWTSTRPVGRWGPERTGVSWGFCPFCSNPTNLRGGSGVELPHAGSGSEMGGDGHHCPQERAPLPH